MTQKIGQGPTQRCDRRCYDAKSGKCECICDGRNHGVGIAAALDNVRTMFLGKVNPQVTHAAERAIRRQETGEGNGIHERA